VEKGGVVRDPAVHRQVLETVLAGAAALGLDLHGLMPSPVRGPAGNVEFLAWWRPGEDGADQQPVIDACLHEVNSA
jgi:23S rRNA (cytidine1920-2'-O)/16S rRNA (cytidine1409-2'-O)-methyltransferase